MGIFRRPRLETPDDDDVGAEPSDQTAQRRQLAIRRRRARSGRDSTVNPQRDTGGGSSSTGSGGTTNTAAPTPGLGRSMPGSIFRMS